MKTTDFITEASLIAQEADEMHVDHEVQMARADCYNAAQYAIQLHKLLKHHSSLDGWVSEKITLANDYLRTVAEYLEHEDAHGEEDQLLQFSESAMNFAVESLISEDGYKDAIEKDDTKFNQQTRDLYSRNTHRFGGDEGVPGSKSMRSSTTATDDFGRPSSRINVGVQKPEGVPKVAKKPITPFGRGSGGGGGGRMDMADPSAVKSLVPNLEETTGVTDYNPKSQGGTRKELIAKYKKSGDPKDAEAARKAGATQKELSAGEKRSRADYGLKEDASAGGMGASSVAISMSGGSGKPGTGVPKKLGNANKTKKVQVGKGVY